MCKLRSQWTACFSSDDAGSENLERRIHVMGIKSSTHAAITVTMAPTDPEADGSSGGIQDEGERYMFHEEWLADVCGVSRRR